MARDKLINYLPYIKKLAKLAKSLPLSAQTSRGPLLLRKQVAPSVRRKGSFLPKRQAAGSG